MHLSCEVLLRARQSELEQELVNTQDQTRSLYARIQSIDPMRAPAMLSNPSKPVSQSSQTEDLSKSSAPKESLVDTPKIDGQVTAENETVLTVTGLACGVAIGLVLGPSIAWISKS